MDAVVRPYKPNDIESCRDLWSELTQRHRDIYDDQTIGGSDLRIWFDEHLKHPRLAGIWVAERESSVAGFCGLLVDGDEGEVEPIVVTAAMRSHGIGRRLLDAMIDEANRRDLRTLSIRPVARNVEAIALFHGVGFRLLGHLDMFMELRDRREWQRGVSIHGKDFQY